MRRSFPIAGANPFFKLTFDNSTAGGMTKRTTERKGMAGFFRAALALALLCLAAPSRAQAPAPPSPPAPSDKKAADLEAKRHDFQGVRDNLAQSEARKMKIEDEIFSYRNDRAKLVSALIDAKNKIEDAEAKVAESQSRLDTLTGSESAIRRSLESRRGVLIEVLAALQRMGRKPPPALLAEPEDVLRAIRASMLLGAVLPELRSETEALASDLQDLVSLRESIAREKADLAAGLQARRDERARLEALIVARQKSIGVAREALTAEQAREKALAGQAANLKDLIARMETELEFGAQGGGRGAQGGRGSRQTQPGADRGGEKAFRRGGVARSGPARPGHRLRRHQRHVVAARAGNDRQILRRAERFRRRREGTLARHPRQRHCFGAKRWLYRLQRSLAQFRATLDH